jgi:hypothetical protein
LEGGISVALWTPQKGVVFNHTIHAAGSLDSGRVGTDSKSARRIQIIKVTTPLTALQRMVSDRDLVADLHDVLAPSRILTDQGSGGARLDQPILRSVRGAHGDHEVAVRLGPFKLLQGATDTVDLRPVEHGE